MENLVWAAGFTNGTKDMDTPGVGSVQVTKINTAEDPFNNGVRADQVEFRGTIRVNLTNQGSVVPGE